MKLLNDDAEAAACLIEELEANPQGRGFFFRISCMWSIMPCLPKNMLVKKALFLLGSHVPLDDRP